MGDTEEERHKLDKKMINFQTDLGQMLNPVVTNSCLQYQHESEAAFLQTMRED